MTYWVNTKSTMNVDRPRRYRSAERDKYLRENIGVDPTLLALDLGMAVSCVINYQRRLGIRPSQRLGTPTSRGSI